MRVRTIPRVDYVEPGAPRYTVCLDARRDNGWMTMHGVARVMALDVGKVRIGVAISDGLGLTAQPLLTVYRKAWGEDLRNVVRLARRQEAVAIVVGNPLHLSGAVSAWGAKVQEFAEELKVRSGLPVHLWDERLSSVAAHELLDEAGRPARGRKEIIDQVAATIILRGWMDAQVGPRPLELESDG